jgi:hypothetical protein
VDAVREQLGKIVRDKDCLELILQAHEDVLVLKDDLLLALNPLPQREGFLRAFAIAGRRTPYSSVPEVQAFTDPARIDVDAVFSQRTGLQ